MFYFSRLDIYSESDSEAEVEDEDITAESRDIASTNHSTSLCGTITKQELCDIGHVDTENDTSEDEEYQRSNKKGQGQSAEINLHQSQRGFVSMT